MVGCDEIKRQNSCSGHLNGRLQRGHLLFSDSASVSGRLKSQAQKVVGCSCVAVSGFLVFVSALVSVCLCFFFFLHVRICVCQCLRVSVSVSVSGSGSVSSHRKSTQKIRVVPIAKVSIRF